MSKIKFKLIPLFIIFLNGVIMAMVMESGYYIANFNFMALLPFQVLPLLLVLGIIGVFKGEGKFYKMGFFLLFLVSIFFLYQLIKATDFLSIPDDIRLINKIIQDDQLIQFAYFENTIKLVMLVSSSVLAATLYIFPFNLVILDGGLLIFLWIVDYNRNSYEYLRYFLPIWAFAIFLYRAGVRDETRKNFKVNNRKRILNALGFTLVISVASMFLNVEAKGIYSDRFRSYFTGQTVSNGLLTSTSLADSFNLKQTGYNNSNTRLGGNITINEEEVLRAIGQPIIYLRGNVKSTYTGNEWLWEERSFEEQSYITNSKMNRFEFLNSDKEIKQLEIRPTRQITSSMFHSLYTRDMTFNNNIAKIFYDETYDTFTGNKTIVNNYKVSYYDESLLGNINEYSSWPASENLDKYLALPETITQRTKNLVAGLVTDNMTNRNKASVITAYLKENYDYSLSPGDLPPGQDFVDNFLFETGEGYCVYFSTALSIMLRIANVPTRYVEGFKMGNEQINGAYIVRNSDAHAWTEVLVDPGNLVWENFDATGTPREMIFGEEALEETPVEQPETPVDEVETPESQINEDDKNLNEEDASPLKIPILVWLVLAVVAGLGLRILYKKVRIKGLYEEKSLIPYFRELNKTLDEIYYHKAPEETYLEFAEKITDEDLKQKYINLVQEVYKEEYGGEVGVYLFRRELQEDVYGLMKEFRGVLYYSLKKYVL